MSQFTIEFEVGGQFVVPAVLKKDVVGGEQQYTVEDKTIELFRAKVEKKIGRALPVDPGTGFPSFTIYQDGEFSMGG